MTQLDQYLTAALLEGWKLDGYLNTLSYPLRHALKAKGVAEYSRGYGLVISAEGIRYLIDNDLV